MTNPIHRFPLLATALVLLLTWATLWAVVWRVVSSDGFNELIQEVTR